MRLGYVSDLAQAAPLVGVRDGLFANALGPDSVVRPVAFTADVAAGSALGAGTLDAAYLSPNSAYDASRTPRRAVTIVAGAASGGASLVTRDELSTPAALRDRTIAVPRHGSAQDVALRAWLGAGGIGIDRPGGVSITAVDSPDTLAAFRSGAIDGAWLPEPWATRLVAEGAARILVDERALWPGGAFASAVLAVRSSFLRAHPTVVKHLVEGHVAAEDLLNTNPGMAQREVAEEIRAITAQDVASALGPAWTHLRFTNDPLAGSIEEAANHAREPGGGQRLDLRGFVDLGALNSTLRRAQRALVGQ